MKKRRKSRARTRIRTVYKKAKTQVRRRAKKAIPLAGLISAGAYGAAREKLSTAIAPYTAKIPLGNISDEVGMMVANYAIGKFVGNKIPMVKQMTKAGMVIEAAQIGQTIMQGNLGLNNTTQSTGTRMLIIE